VVRAEEEAVIEPLRQANWLALGEAREFGVAIEMLSNDSALDDAVAGCDVLIISATRAVAAFRAAGRAADDGPRLVVAIGSAMPTGIAAGLLRPPAGVSAIWLEERSAPSAIEQLILAIVHDLSLPEAVHEVRRTGAVLDPALVSDPVAAQELRMAQAFGTFTRRWARLQSQARVGDLERFLKRLPADSANLLEPRLRGASAVEAELRATVEPLQHVRVDFGRESWGLRPLAEAEWSLAAATRLQRHIELELGDLAREAESREVLAAHQQRRADFSLRRDGMPPLVEPGETLQPGARYHLLIQIGTPSPASLLKDEPPPLDPLLPDVEPGQGHDLDVVIFPQDFRLEGASTRDVHLPEAGGTAPVEFELSAPDWDEQRQASARIGIYHENHLVQSFRLASLISSKRDWAGGEGVRVELEFSRTRRFQNLDQLRPRAISLGLNADETGNHRLLLKTEGASEDLLLDASLLDSVAQRFRDELANATFLAGDRPRFPIRAARSQASEDCLAVLRQLARQGRELHRELFARSSDAFKAELREFAKARDETVQIVRHDPNYAFPWAAVYDFLLPDDPSAPVCLGVEPDGKPCQHRLGDQVWCANGFWGVRHQVEQFLVLPDSSEPQQPRPLAAPRARPPVLLTLGVEDASTKRLRDRLGERSTDFVAELERGTDFYDVLWSDRRPAVAVVIGHLDELAPRPRILLPERKLLEGGTLIDRAFADGGWTDPRSLVLLLACGTASTKLATLSGLPLAFNTAGATAVIGTEAKAFSGLVGRFAEEVITSLWEGASLGAAVTSFRRNLFQAGIPLPFVFTAFGDADLTLTH